MRRSFCPAGGIADHSCSHGSPGNCPTCSGQWPWPFPQSSLLSQRLRRPLRRLTEWVVFLSLSFLPGKLEPPLLPQTLNFVCCIWKTSPDSDPRHTTPSSCLFPFFSDLCLKVVTGYFPHFFFFSWLRWKYNSRNSPGSQRCYQFWGLYFNPWSNSY